VSLLRPRQRRAPFLPCGLALQQFARVSHSGTSPRTASTHPPLLSSPRGYKSRATFVSRNGYPGLAADGRTIPRANTSFAPTHHPHVQGRTLGDHKDRPYGHVSIHGLAAGGVSDRPAGNYRNAQPASRVQPQSVLGVSLHRPAAVHHRWPGWDWA
jgi:hypothetical protein